MLLKKIIKNLPIKILNINIEGLSLDSRKIKRNYLFFAVRGAEFNGEKYISNAINKGAKAVVCSLKCKIKNNKVPIIKVKNISRAIDVLKKNDYWIYGATDRANDDVNDIIFKSPIALIIGGESSGLRKKTLENCDFTLKINMNGVVESLNMAVATGILINTIYSKIK